MVKMKLFSKKICDWYQLNKRDLPWRNVNDPYKIWLSEIILQQTRVNQGLEYYHKFVEHYPTVEMLAKANEEQILKLWQGLGYYSRARNLHKAAKQVVAEHKGKFPSEYNDLIKLKGVGVYTASAIASFAYNILHIKVGRVEQNITKSRMGRYKKSHDPAGENPRVPFWYLPANRCS